MNDLLANREYGRAKSGDLVAALLLSSVVLALAAVVAATYVFLSPSDVLLARVPATAVAYVHADGRAAVKSLSDLRPTIAPVTSATEIAAYATLDESGALVWHSLVGWRWPYAPTPADRAALEAAHATFLDGRVARLGAHATDAAFGLDRDATDALAATRSHSHIQAYADLSPLRPLAKDAPITKDRFAAGVSLRADGALAQVVRIDEAAEGNPLSLDPFTVLFGHPANNPDSDPGTVAVATETARFLDAHLATTVILDPGTPAARAQIVLQDTAIPETRDAIAAYTSLHWPERGVLTLPDGDILTELRTASAPTDTTLRLGPTPKDAYVLHQTPRGVTVAKKDDTPWTPQSTPCAPGNPTLVLTGQKGILPWIPYTTITLTERKNAPLTVCARK